MPRKRNFLNVKTVLELNVQVWKTLGMFGPLPPLLEDMLRQQGMVSQAILKKHAHSRKDIRIPAN